MIDAAPSGKKSPGFFDAIFAIVVGSIFLNLRDMLQIVNRYLIEKFFDCFNDSFDEKWRKC